jgi:hypothetical protein
MASKINDIMSFLGGFLALVRKPAKNEKADEYKIKCENCGHIDLYDNFEPSDDSCYSFFCPSCDDWTYECAVE